MLCEEKVAFVTLGAGNPVPHIPAFHAAGIKVIPVVPNVKLAKRIELQALTLWLLKVWRPVVTSASRLLWR